jgi:cation diffusion facilitator CzcD-associated flavoprotein CzcO
MSGLYMGLRLSQDDAADFVIYEKADEVGGTWRENRYPGIACDVPSRFYTYSKVPNAGWSSLFPPGDEIWAYFRNITDDHGLREHIRFSAEVTLAEWRDEQWVVSATDGSVDTYDFVVTATGVLHHPKSPEIPGLDDFEGVVCHSARWADDAEAAGRRVGVIGNGSTGTQIVSALSKRSEHLDLFLRTPQWMLPVPNRRYSAVGRYLGARVPLFNRVAYNVFRKTFEQTFGEATTHPGWQRTVMGAMCRLNLRRIRDRELRAKLTPSYEPMCKRIVLSWDFYRAVQRPTVNVVTDAIERVERTGIRTTDGEFHQLDMIVLATGFDALAFMRPMNIVGPGGRTLAKDWAARPTSYNTVAVPGFPNLFTLIGPFSPVGNFSVIAIAEVQVGYVLDWLEMWRDAGLRPLAPKTEAGDRFIDAVHSAMGNTTWATGCTNWYMDAEGTPVTYPWGPVHHRNLLAHPTLADYEPVTSSAS